MEAQPFPTDLEKAIRDEFAMHSGGIAQASFAVRYWATAEVLPDGVVRRATGNLLERERPDCRERMSDIDQCTITGAVPFSTVEFDFVLNPAQRWRSVRL